MNNYDESRQGLLARMADAVELLYLSLKLQLGGRFWLYPFLPLVWVLLLYFMDLVGFANIDFIPINAQNSFIGIPLCLLAITIGMQIISSEIEQRTLEVCYTVPGGAQRIWLSKLAAALVILLTAELIIALFTRLVFTTFPLSSLYRILQGAVFYLVLSMAFGAMFRNKMTAGMAAVILLFLNGALTNFGDNPTRFSPLFNPLGLSQSMSEEELLYWLIQNHIGYALLTLTMVILTFSRTERRELLLSDD